MVSNSEWIPSQVFELKVDDIKELKPSSPAIYLFREVK